jgi:hypothetical protein
MACLAQKVLRVTQVILVLRVTQVILVLRAIQASKVKQVCQEPPALKDKWGRQFFMRLKLQMKIFLLHLS